MSTSDITEQLLTNQINKVVKNLQGSYLESKIKETVQDHVCSKSSYSVDLDKEITEALKTDGYEKVLRNTAHRDMNILTTQHYNGKTTLCETEREPLSCIRKAQQNWEKRIAKSLNTMCTELNLSLAKKRSDKDIQDLAGHWAEIGTLELEHSTSIRPVYGAKDFLEVMINISITNKEEELLSSHAWGLINTPVYVQSLNDLRVQYNDMAINQCQNGVDDEVEVPQELFANERFKMGRKVLANNESSLAQEFCKRGCPVSLRGGIWRLALGVEITNADRLYYEQLKQSVLQHDMMIDLLYYKDIKLTSTNDDQYFVFEDYAFQVLLPFSRDTKVLSVLESSSGAPPKSYIRGKLGLPEYCVVYPPNGIIPCHGFSMLLAPLCYIYDDIHTLYFVFREMYFRYFHKLHIISSQRDSILGLAITFESLLQTQEAQLFFHLKTQDIQPLRIVFKWILRAFSGFLASREVLLLWDKIFAYDSLEIIPILAVAIFSFRKLNLMQVITQGQAEAVLADLTTIKVIPLLQLSLFSK